MLRRWDRKAYDFGLLMGILDLILGSMDLESIIKERRGRGRGRRRGRGRKPLRPAGLYLKVLVLKEMDKLSLRYAESCSSMHFGERIPGSRSTLSYWELNYGFLVEEVLKVLFASDSSASWNTIIRSWIRRSSRTGIRLLMRPFSA
jgi:hypothetical protein